MLQKLITWENISALVTFLALLFGFLGDTRNEATDKLTKTGWAALTVGIIAFGMSIFQNVKTQNELDKVKIDKQTMEISSYESLHNALHGRLFPFHVLCNYTFAKYRIEKYESNFYPIFDNLKSEKFLYHLDSVDMDENMYLQSLPDSWKDGFSKNTENFQKKIQFLLNSNQYFDSETVTILNYILDHEPVMNERIKKFLDSEDMKGVGISYVLGTSHVKEEYLIYIDKLKRLFEIVYVKVPNDKLTNGVLEY